MVQAGSNIFALTPAFADNPPILSADDQFDSSNGKDKREHHLFLDKPLYDYSVDYHSGRAKDRELQQYPQSFINEIDRVKREQSDGSLLDLLDP